MNELQRDELLFIPSRRRLVHDKSKDAEGREELHIFYGPKEIVFDEPELMSFGEQLLLADRFRAEEATGWSAGAPHSWETVRDLLEALLEAEILKRVPETASEANVVRTFPERLGLAPEDRVPRTFSAHEDQCPHITQEAHGRAFDLPNLEVVVPVYRVAHSAMDTDGRQVGENNATPRCLFLDLPALRRVCNYAGDRYQADTPMNVTALKLMTKRWPELLSLTEQFRTALLARLPPREGPPCAGDLHLLSVCTLAAVGYVMVRGEHPVPNGELDPGLSGMFRLIDGVRLVTTEIVRATAGEQGCATPVDARTIASTAERGAIYHGEFGVCAGPPALIDEYLRVLTGEMNAPIAVEPDVAARLGDLDAALDYGLLGQQLEAMVRLFGSTQVLLHLRLRDALHGHEPRTALHEALEAPIDAAHYRLLRETHPLVETLELELLVNRWIYHRAGEGLSPAARVDAIPAEELEAVDASSVDASQRRLGELVAEALPAMAAPLRDEICAVAAEVFARERRCLRMVARVQATMNQRLRRAGGRPLTGEDLAVYNRPRSGPSFAATLATGLGLARIASDAERTVLSLGPHDLTLTD